MEFQNESLPLASRTDDLIRRLTLGEKVGQLMHDNPAIPRLQIPAYSWWNEACHGVGRNGRATVFPQTISLAATFDRNLVRRVGDVIASEARIKFAEARAAHPNGTLQYQGLTFWTPNINLYRDPRWGRGQETFGEDPFLTGELGAELVRGLQGDDPLRLKVAACAKHFAVHSGPEVSRHRFDSRVGPRDLAESYLPQFARLVAAGAEAVMGAYNRLNGEPCCASPWLQRLLRQDWGFQGHFVSDCGAIDDFHRGHQLTADAVESAALALRTGCDLNCGCTYNELHLALTRGLVTEADLDRALRRTLSTKFKLGLFDFSPDRHPSGQSDSVDGPAHREVAIQAAVNSIVLLKNNGILPLRNSIKSVMITGPSAASTDALLGNYFGLSSKLVTFVEGLVAAAPPGTRLGYSMGCAADGADAPSAGAIWECSMSDVTIAIMGLLPIYEGEEGDAFASRSAGDRTEIELPEVQLEYLRRLKANGKPLVLVLTGGGPVAIPEAAEWCDAILLVWYPGCEGGNALSEILWGKSEPGGRLPVTVPVRTADLPAFEDYAMEGRTYRYLEKEPLYPFGFGLGYTDWELSAIELELGTDSESGVVGVTVRNIGQRKGRTIIQFYRIPPAGPSRPKAILFDFCVVNLGAGESTRVLAVLTEAHWQLHDADGVLRRVTGEWRIAAATASPGPRALALGSAQPAYTTVSIDGS